MSANNAVRGLPPTCDLFGPYPDSVEACGRSRWRRFNIEPGARLLTDAGVRTIVGITFRTPDRKQIGATDADFGVIGIVKSALRTAHHA